MDRPSEVFSAELLDLAAHRKVYGFKCSPKFSEALDTAKRLARVKGDTDNGLAPAPRRETSSARPRMTWSRRTAVKKRSPGKAGAAEPEAGGSLASTHLGLIGLALSGGGIRSATFNLGLLQAFGKNGLLDRTDYLSTVSGGGYIGCCVSSLLTDPKASSSGPAFPLHQGHDQSEPLALAHLRNTAYYLAPGGVLDRIRIPALLIRGILINMLILLPYVLVAVVLTEWLWGDSLRALASGRAASPSYYRAPMVASLLLAAWILLFPVVRRSLSLAWASRDRLEQTFAAALTLVAAMFCINSLPHVLRIHQKTWSATDGFAGGDFRSFAAVLTSLVPFLFARKFSEMAETWRTRLALYSLGLLAPFILFIVYLNLAAARIFAESSIIFRNPFWTWVEHAAHGLDVGILALATVIFLFAWIAVDVNLTSLHGFYRDRLSRAYLFTVAPAPDAPKGSAAIQPNDTQLLSRLNSHAKAPYHLINATLNLQGRRNPAQRGRSADFFVFAKHFSGSDRTGFCRTEELERRDSRLDLATAMAISGAAVSGNMGTSPLRSLVLIMTLLNVRTGYWLPNPRLLDRPRHKLGVFTGVGPWFLLREFLGWLGETSRYVNVSDGGHLENLGIYELLRRRCRFIVACDAESDRDMAFGGLATVIRYARIDLGVEIKISLKDLRPGNAGLCTSHYAIGEIHYPGGENGQLLYVKASLTGDESVDILEYRGRNPRFPHQSTAQQFFDEAQFEAYRQLGYHVAECLLPNPLQGASGYPELSVSKWFRELEGSMSRQDEPGVEDGALVDS